MTYHNTNQRQALPGAKKKGEEADGPRIVRSIEGLKDGYFLALSGSGDPGEAIEALFHQIDALAARVKDASPGWVDRG